MRGQNPLLQRSFARWRFFRLLFPMSPLLFRFGFLFLTLLSAVTARADVIISEFLANNNTGLADEDGERGDWIELYNDGASVVNLNGWRLTDELGNLTKWTLPAVMLEPKGFLIVFASNKDRTNPAGVLHTNFKLSASGDTSRWSDRMGRSRPSSIFTRRSMTIGPTVSARASARRR
jgi:hypothetical protein